MPRRKPRILTPIRKPLNASNIERFSQVQRLLFTDSLFQSATNQLYRLFLKELKTYFYYDKYPIPRQVISYHYSDRQR